MAALAIAAVGSVIGGALIPAGILGVSGAAIGYFAGSLLASAIIKPPGQQGPRLGDLRVQGTEYGQAFPWVAGAPRLAGQIVWASNRREIANTQKVGKGGGQKVTTFTYEVDLLIVLSENVTGGISRAWLNGEMVFNGVAKEGLWSSITVYTGDADQLPDPTYEAAVGVGNAPAYRGRTSVLIQGLQLGNSGQIGNLTFEIGGLDYSDVLFFAPLNDQTLYSDIRPYPQSPILISGPTLAFTADELLFGPQNDRVFWEGGKFDLRASGTADRYLSFDFSVTVTGGSILGNPQRFLEFLATTGGGLPPSSQLFVASGGRIDLSIFSSAVGAVNLRINGIPQAGNILLRWPVGTSDQIDVYIDGVFRGSLSGFATRSCDRFGFNTSSNTISGAHVSRYGISNVMYGFGDPPTLGIARPPISEVVSDLMVRAGYDPDEYDVDGLAALTKPVRGMSIGQITNTRGPLETLQTAFFFEPSKSDKIYFNPRPVSAVVDIPFEDLRAAADAVNDDEPLALTVGNELEVPAQVSLSYANMLGDYNVATEHSDRMLTGQESNQVVQLGLGMLPSEAKGVADALLLDQLASLTRTTIRLPLKYARIEPGDAIRVTNQDGREYRLRSQTKRDNLLIIEHECSLDDATALTSAQITSDDYALTEDVRQIAPTIWEAMDIPILRDADNQAGFYFALAPNRAIPKDEWPGAVAVRSWSADAFENLFTSGDACVMGVCTTTLGDFDGGSGRFDEGHTLTVRVTGELASTTRADMLDDLSINAALVGSEILRFRLAELLGTVDGENEYRLSGFVRGQRGTEQHIGTHVAAERFVLLNASLRRVLNQNSEIGVASEVKAVTLNTLLSAVTAESFTDTGVSLMPFSVAGLRALADGADIVLTWNRRTRRSYRYGGTVGASVPLGEATEAYRIDVYDGATLVNTYTATDGTYTYAAADITADGLTTGDTITFVVRQLSEIVGPGFPATIERAAP